jgi:uncharacterized BrkB/YihY/UPF0761 family membrane protein
LWLMLILIFARSSGFTTFITGAVVVILFSISCGSVSRVCITRTANPFERISFYSHGGRLPHILGLCVILIPFCVTTCVILYSNH